MDPKTPIFQWIETIFDVSQPYLYVLVLPPLVLFAIGFRRLALLWFLGAAAVLAFLGAT